MGYPVCLYGPVSYPKLRSGLTSIVTPTERNLRNSPENRVTRSAEKIVKHYTNCQPATLRYFRIWRLQTAVQCVRVYLCFDDHINQA